ncbi:transglycosylase SLT domain-containing protein [Streptomyces smyrnaeus]|uniref:Transglycosylase SLT domain-containing protein n=1 Tax=Streptomyces smyrnaeus TaxID=1387713 RepID=A0ABS3Y5R4_9ACTN|nr:transglycosylase SLT domain-containing protein [Streptomyces smyrnaeus]MBO8203007.1 transglycosylase SLT domain-containing protein [Streptomyces smyrnaeus]
MRTALRSLKPARLATTGLTALGAAGIATTALAGTAHAAQAPAKPATKPAAVAHAHDAKATKAAKDSDKADAKAKDEKKAEKKAGGKEYADNLDGWIREARAIMKEHGIPGSYEGIKRNIIRESAGDPNAVNDWDINAKKGTPSKGLLQVIQPTFDRYHVEGTPDELTDPVANIVAACNYAADRYGSMDNVDSAY